MKILILLSFCWLVTANEYNEQFHPHDLCMNGKTQSPIDLEKLGAKALYKTDRTLYFDYTNWTLDGVDEGAELSQKHSKPAKSRATLTIEDADATTCKKVEYEAIQFHWHTPSEHTFEIRDEKNKVTGNRGDLEFHLVHVMKDAYVDQCSGRYRQLLVLGVSFAAHQSTSMRYTGDAFFNHMNLGDSHRQLPKPVALIGSYLETWFAAQGAYHYKGSLTTPTCGESVEWYVAKEVQKIEEVAINRMKEKLRDPSNRDVQALNDRTLFYLPKTQFKKGDPVKVETADL